MDPVSALGLISSVAQLADASFKIINLLDTIKEGGRERRKLCDEITLLWMTLRNLETQFALLSAEQNGAWMKPIDSLAEPNGVFTQIRSALDEVWEKLTTSESKFGKVKQTLRWPLDNDYVARTIGRIEHLKTSIIMVEGQANIALAQEMREEVSAVKKTVNDGQFKEIIDWLSPCNFRQKQENITATPGTGGWFFTSEEFKSWESGDDRWLWCYGIPGAGKTFLASNAVNELRRLHTSDDALVLVAFCSFDSADSQSIDHLVASLLKQIVQIRMTLPDNLENLYHKHYASETRPKLTEICDIIGNVLSQGKKTYIVLDALDELDDDKKRMSLLEILHGLKGRPKIMVTSRKLESIANRFGYPLDGIYCDGCKKKHLEFYYHCEDCVDFDHCEDCRKEGERGGHAFIKRFSSIKLRIAARPEDIESYVNRRIEVEDELRVMVDKRPNLQAQILDMIVDNAQDMFLLARFHMDVLADCLTVGEILNALHHLPQGINATYDQAMARIGKLSANRQRAVKRLLLWISYAERPLTIQELEHATAVSRGVHEIRTEHVLSAKVLTSMSAGLVIIDENENVRLTHKTAESYFLEKRSDLFPDGDIEIAECCLAYLQLTAFESGPCSGPNEADEFDARLKVYPFFGYASLYWGVHAQRCKSDLVTPQALMFLRNRMLLEASVQALWYTDIASYDSWDVSGGVDALHLASFFGLNKIVSGLLDEGADVNARDSLGTPSLTYVCFKGYLDVANTLLEAGASANIVDDRGSTALHRSVKGRYIELTRRLVQEKDVAINAWYTSWSNWTPLIIACYYDDVDLVKILLSRADIDPNLASPTARWNPLLLAADMDHQGSVEALLQHPKVDKNYQDIAGYTAIHYAALSGNVGSVKALLNGGVDTEIQDDQGGRPIQRAIDYDQFATVKLLLDHPVEWNFRDVLGRTVFHAAAINDCTQILRLLLETCKDIDIDAQGDSGETALHDAARCGYLETTKVLLEFGARTDVLNKGGRTPVRAAKDAGHTDVLEILRVARERERELDKQHEVHSLCKADTFASKSEVPLSNAVEQEDIETLRVRISRTDPDELNAYSPDTKDTPLHMACQRRGVEIVNMLLEAGAFVDPMDAFYRTPLTIACQKGEPNIVQALVKYGADVNVTKFDDRPPWEIALQNGGSKAAIFLLSQPQTQISSTSGQLHKALGWAAAFGNLQACKRLVGAGAPIQLKNANGMTPLQVAKSWENEEVEKFLFEAATKIKSSPSPSPEVPTIDTFQVGEKRDEGGQEGIGHPPRRSPTSKKEFLDLAKPGILQDENISTGAALLSLEKVGAKSLWSSPTLGMALGLLAIVLALMSSFRMSCRAFG